MNFGEELLPPAAPSNGAASLVTQGFANAQQYAGAAFTEAVGFLADLSTTASKLTAMPLVDGTLPSVNELVDGFVMPALPAAPGDLSMHLPSAPVAPTLATVTDISVGNVPDFTAQLPAINLNIPVPSALVATVPLAPSLPDVVVPDAPTVVLPDVPSLLGINVPTEPLLNLPTFTALTPDSPLAPANTFAFAETTYTSGLLQDLRGVLDTWVNGTSTGLSPEVEAAIWNRGRDREMAASMRKMGESIRMYASRGFAKPQGALNLDIQQALQDSQSTLSDQSRDVMTKQADLEQSNRKFAFDTAWKVEQGLIEYNGQIAQRALETAKYVQQIGIDVYHETVIAYTADIQKYSASVEAFKAALQAELSKLDVYKAELEGQKLISELNAADVDIYRARITAAQAIVDIFRAQVDAANTKAQINKTTIDGFAQSVNAYGETVRAKASEYDMYATQVKAEVSKADVFNVQASAYGQQVQGFKAAVDALVAQKNIQIKVGQEVPLDLFKTMTEAYRTQVGAESDRIGALVKAYEANTSVFSAEVQGESSRVNSEVAVIKSATDIATATGNLRVEAAKANVQAMMQQLNYLIEAVKSGAQVAAQLAAASLSSVNLSGQIGDHTTYGVGFNVSNSTSESNSQVLSNTFSTSQATNISQLTSDSTSTSTTTNVNTSSQTSNSVVQNYNN